MASATVICQRKATVFSSALWTAGARFITPRIMQQIEIAMSLTAKPATGALPQNAPELQSRLLALPPELRDEIYMWVLGSTRITFGERRYKEFVRPVAQNSSPRPLALLYTCREIHQEIGQRWIGWILVKFLAPEMLLDTLTRVPTNTVAAIRHIETHNRPVQFVTPDREVCYKLCWFMKMVPQLRLDTLTVLGGRANPVAARPDIADYDTIDGLITYGTGWRELHYLTPSSSMFAFEEAEYRGSIFRRMPQPDTWRSALYQRDGADSGASLTIYRSKTARLGSIHNPLERETFEQVLTPAEVEEYGIESDETLMEPSEKGRGVLVIVKRGRNTDILEEFPTYDWRVDMRAFDMPWRVLMDLYVVAVFAVDPDDESEDIERNCSPSDYAVTRTGPYFEAVQRQHCTVS